MKKIIGFKMMLGEWANNVSNPLELLDFQCTNVGKGISQIDGLNRIDTNDMPENIMSNYSEETTIMTFKFYKPLLKSELPKTFIESANGIIIGKSNTELIYE